MSFANTIQALQQWSKQNSGDPHIWNGNAGTYQWSIGKTTRLGILNGVVRKLAGADLQGTKIWVVAGSFKINEAGNILRFTGLARKDQLLIEGIAAILAKAEQVELTEA